MITVDQKQLDQVEYLLKLSIQGHHVLFDSETLAHAFKSDSARKERSPGQMKTLESHLEKLLAQPTFMSKRAYLERLDRSTKRELVRVYINIVENSLYQKKPLKH